MPSPGEASDTDRACSTSSTSKSTSALACAAGTSTSRRCRWASARTCHICQVERRSSIPASTWLAVCATHRAPVILVAWKGGVSAVRVMDATASSPPNTAEAASIQVARCSERDRGSCLASRVSNVAC